MLFTTQDIAAAREILLDFHAGVADLIKAYGNKPHPGSVGDTELSSGYAEATVRTIYGQADMLVETAGDQITGFVKLITEPVEALAPWNTVRGALEASAIGCWLLATSVDLKERVGRSIALRCEGLLQQKKWARAANVSQGHVDSRIAKMIAEGKSIGLAALKNSRGALVGLGRQMPPVTDIVRDELGEEAMYRLLSAVAHGHHWAVAQIGFRVVPDQVGDDGYRALEKAPMLSGVMYIARGASAAFSLLVQRQTLYCGWPTGHLSELHDVMATRFDEITAAAAARG